MTITFDFSRIATMPDFYQSFQKQYNLDSAMGRNLDALYDILTGHLPMPQHITFINLSLPQLEVFDALIQTIEDAQDALSGELTFSYSIRRDY